MNIEQEQLNQLVETEQKNFEHIESKLSAFNPFSVLGISHYEIRHSNFIAWILNPSESHRLGDMFLVSFILSLPNLPEEIRINVQRHDLSDTKVFREWNNIDILVINEQLKFTIVIENKIWSGKRLNQLKDYSDLVFHYWSKEIDEESMNILHLYLTPFPRYLSEEEISIGYENITLHLIQNLLLDTANSEKCNPEIKQFIYYYIDNINRKIMNNNENDLTRLAQEIYRKNRAAIDFIYSKRPVIYTPENHASVINYLVKTDKYTLYYCDDGIIRFLPVNLIKYFRDNRFHSWPKTEVCICIEIFVEEKRIWAKFCFGGIQISSQAERIELQRKKDKYFEMLKSLKSLAKIKSSRSKSTSKYPGFATYEILNVTQETFINSKNFQQSFEIAFNKFESEIVIPWENEVLQLFSIEQ